MQPIDILSFLTCIWHIFKPDSATKLSCLTSCIRHTNSIFHSLTPVTEWFYGKAYVLKDTLRYNLKTSREQLYVAAKLFSKIKYLFFAIPMKFWPGLKPHYDRFHMHVVQKEWMDDQTVKLFKEVLIPLFWLDSYPNWL